MALTDEQRAAIDRAAESMAGRYARRPPSAPKVSKAAVVANNADGTLDVSLQGAVLTVPCTTSCIGAVEGDTAVVETFQGMAIATGVLADNAHYVQTDYAESMRGEMKIYTGSMVKVAAGTSVLMWTHDDFASRYGAYTMGKTFIGVFNGDGNAASVHVDGVEYNSNGIYAVFDRSLSGNIRLNVMVVN